MLRRISSRFPGKKKDEAQRKGLINGATNGMVNGDHNPTEHAVQHPDAPDYSVIQDDVQSNFEKFAPLLHASSRPLPTQSSDGASLQEGQPSGFLKDLKTLGYKDYNTMLHVMKGKVTGNLQETFKDGKLKPDCFSESRLLGFPPGCGVLLIMLNRFHNYVVEQLAVINESGRFSMPRDGLPEEMKAKALAKRDHDLFNTGRLITCGLYINITLFDYLRTIVNLNRCNTTWTLDPRAKMGNGYSNSGTPSGVGNAVSAEFNLAYRWHSCISEKDDLWTQNLYKELFGKSADEVSFTELLQGLGKWEHGLDPDPQKRPFGKLERGPDGKLPDEGLARILTESIEDVAGRCLDLVIRVMLILV
ncbi:MAG: hypothetical protein Q9223_005362 [Gallowayella weberi]